MRTSHDQILTKAPPSERATSDEIANVQICCGFARNGAVEGRQFELTTRSNIRAGNASHQCIFYVEERVTRALGGIRFQVKKGETLGVVGESGRGKSVTALSILGILLKLSARTVGGAHRSARREALCASRLDARRRPCVRSPIFARAILRIALDIPSRTAPPPAGRHARVRSFQDPRSIIVAQCSSHHPPHQSGCPTSYHNRLFDRWTCSTPSSTGSGTVVAKISR